MAIQDDRPPAGTRPDGPKALLEIVVDLRPPIDVTATAARAAAAALVVGVDVEPGGRQLVTDMLVATGVLAEAVDEEDRCP